METERPALFVTPSLARCPYCHSEVALAEETWVACATCLARHHGACWNEALGCSTCGAEASLAARARPARAPWLTTALWGALALVGLAIFGGVLRLGHDLSRRAEALRDAEWARAAQIRARADLEAAEAARTRAETALRGARAADAARNGTLDQKQVAELEARVKALGLEAWFDKTSRGYRDDPLPPLPPIDPDAGRR